HRLQYMCWIEYVGTDPLYAGMIQRARVLDGVAMPGVVDDDVVSVCKPLAEVGANESTPSGHENSMVSKHHNAPLKRPAVCLRKSWSSRLQPPRPGPSS